MFRQRCLLARRADVEGWLAAATEAGAHALPELAAHRPLLDASLKTTDALVKRYQDASAATLPRIASALRLLPDRFEGLLHEVFGSSPVERWVRQLERLAATHAGTQSWYGFTKDVVDTWNELRDVLFADIAHAMPAVGAFPKHLLLGDLSAHGQCRTALSPSPVDAVARVAAAEARGLLRRLDALVTTFAPATTGVLRVTPSLGPSHALGERAIPAYYRPDGAGRASESWNFRLASRGQSGHNLGYHADRWATSDRARAPLDFALDPYDVFRIEGHLGKPVKNTVAELRRLVGSRNLPFEVEAVLLDGQHRGKILIKPDIRYSSLHSLHHLVRKDVNTRIEEGATFGNKLTARIQQAVAGNTLSAADAPRVDVARSASSAVESIQHAAAPALTASLYTQYRAKATWADAMPAAVEAIGNARASLGEISRNDFISPYDTLISSNQSHWLTWIDQLIDARDDRADSRLLLSAFLGRHPGLEHIGGVRRGGTWVLVYDSAGTVVADFSLPYPAAEHDEPEPDEPPLKLPGFLPPAIFDRPVTLIPPIGRLVDNAFVDVRKEWDKDLKIHNAAIEGMTKTIINWQAPRVNADTILTGNKRLDDMMTEVRIRNEAVLEATRYATQAGIDEEQRRKAEEQLKRSQDDLAISLGRVAEHLVTNEVDLATGQTAHVAPLLMGSMGLIKDAGASETIKTRLTTLRDTASGSQQSMLDGMAVVGGFQLARR